jgi:hypothetical protein
MKDATAKIFDLEERLRPSRDAAERQRVLAPIRVRWSACAYLRPARWSGPREVLMEVVPEEKVLIVEARIRPEDINYVRPGSEADIRLTAYKQRTTPLVQGAVTYVSGDRMVDEQTKQAYYVVHVNVAQASLEQPATCGCRPECRGGLHPHRQPQHVDYLAAPVTGYLRRAAREPL